MVGKQHTEEASKETFIRKEKEKGKEGRGQRRRRPQVQSQLLPVSYSEAMVIEEVCRLFAISEQQHADDTIQGEDGRALCAYGVCNIECPEGILTDLKEAMSRQAQRETTDRQPHSHELLLHLSSCASSFLNLQILRYSGRTL